MGKRTGEKVVLFVGALIYASIVLFPCFGSQWGLIDDHWIIMIIGGGRRLLLDQIPSVLANVPEFSGFGSYTRFQPVLVLGHILQALLWGDNPNLWYVAHVAFFAFTAFCFLLIAVRILGFGLGCILGFLLLSHHFWADVWARTSAAEAYAAPAFALYCVALFVLWQTERAKPKLWYAFLGIGAIVAIGSKENFLFIFIPTFCLMIHDCRLKRLSLYEGSIGSLIVIFTMFVVGGLLLGLQSHGSDFYSNSLLPMDRIKHLFDSLLSINANNHFPIIIPVSLSVFIFLCITFASHVHSNGKINNDLYGEIKKIVLVEVSLFILFSIQDIIYNGTLPRGMRYDFPGVLFVDCAYWYPVFVIFKKYSGSVSSFIQKNVVKGVVLTIASILLFTLRLPEIKAIYSAAALNRERTQQFSRALSQLVTQAKEKPSTPIIIESHWVWDHEPVVALQRYLGVNGVANPVSVKVVGWSQDTVAKNHETVLAKMDIERYRDGDFDIAEPTAPAGMTRVPLQPYREPDPRRPCFVVSFSGEPTLKCMSFGRLPFGFR